MTLVFALCCKRGRGRDEPYVVKHAVAARKAQVEQKCPAMYSRLHSLDGCGVLFLGSSIDVDRTAHGSWGAEVCPHAVHLFLDPFFDEWLSSKNTKQKSPLDIWAQGEEQAKP